MPPAMNTFTGWFLMVFVLAAAWPGSVWLVTRGQNKADGWLPLLLSLALSTGGLTLVMFWLALLNIRFAVLPITLVYTLVMLPGWWLWWRGGRLRPVLNLPQRWPERLALLLLVLISVGILFNSLYWPFSREDALGIYVPFAEQMALQRVLPELPGAFTVYEAYPPLMQLTYAYVYLASGWHNELLARLIPALMSIGCLAAAYTLARTLHGRLAGWISALLLGLTPSFVSWASSGYVDLPMAFFYTLAAIFAWRLWQGGALVDAVLTGALVGLAAWTKNAALVGVGLLAVWLVWTVFRRRIGWTALVMSLVACVVVAAPWYIRNWIGANLIIPPSVWTEQASQSLDTLLILVTRPQDYSLTGVVVLVGLVLALVDFARRRLNAPAYALLLGWTLPFFGFWWLFASYDPRFILLFLPLWCVIAGVQMARLTGAVPPLWRSRLLVLALLLAVILTMPVLWDSVENKDEILRHPLMSVEERRMIAIRERQPELYERWYGEPAP